MTEVTDGDTIRVKSLEATGPARYTVRLIGIDTPEVYGGIECGGRQASAHMKRIALAGRRVLLRTDPTQATFDRYDRLLAYVKLRGGPDAAISQLRAGRAMVYVYGGNPFQRVRSFRRTQRAAREAVRGAWDTCDGNFPSRAPVGVARLGRLAGRESGREGHLTAMSCRKFPSRRGSTFTSARPFEARGGRVRAETSERQEDSCEQASGSWP